GVKRECEPVRPGQLKAEGVVSHVVMCIADDVAHLHASGAGGATDAINGDIIIRSLLRGKVQHTAVAIIPAVDVAGNLRWIIGGIAVPAIDRSDSGKRTALGADFGRFS